MKLKKPTIIYFLLVFICFLTPVSADFQLGDSCLPIDEEGFIEYDFEDEFADSYSKVEVNFVDIYEFDDLITGIGVNITVNESNSTSNTSNILIVDNIPYQNLTCLLYNKTHQFFKYDEKMNNLLMHGYGGYYVLPNDPVDINIVKVFIESYTAWSANVSQNTVFIETGNSQAILTYNERGILLKEEIKYNDELISTLKLRETKDGDGLDFGLIISLTIIIGVPAALIPIAIFLYKKFRV